MPRRPAPEAETEQTRPWADMPAEVAECLDLAADGADDSVILEKIQAADLGGRAQVDLFRLVAVEWQKAAELAAQAPALAEERNAAERYLTDLKRFQPDSIAQVKEVSVAKHEAEREHSRLANLAGAAEQNTRYLRWFALMFNTTTKNPFPNAKPPAALHRWFVDHRCDPYEWCSWLTAGNHEPAPRPIISSPARVNEA